MKIRATLWSKWVIYNDLAILVWISKKRKPCKNQHPTYSLSRSARYPDHHAHNRLLPACVVPSNISACASPPSLQQQGEDADDGGLDSLAGNGEGQDVDGGELNSLGSNSEWEDSHGDRMGSRAGGGEKENADIRDKGEDTTGGSLVSRASGSEGKDGCGATGGCG